MKDLIIISIFLIALAGCNNANETGSANTNEDQKGDETETPITPAQLYDLGNKYYHGDSVEENVTKAMECYILAAEQGHAAAQYNAGWMYENGKSVPEDIEIAREWYKKAADQGDTKAKENYERLSAQDN